MPRPRPRPRPRTRLAVAALGAGLVLPALATLPSQAVIGSATVTLDDCEVVLVPSQVISDNGTWTTTIGIDHPSPVPAYSSQTVGFDLGSVPAGTFPEDLTDTALYIYAEFEDGRGGDLSLSPPTAEIGTLDASEPLALGSPDVDNVRYYYSGRYELGLKKLEVEVYGRDASGELQDYVFSCDRPAQAVPIVEFGVFDPEADAAITLDSFQATQGQSIGIDGRDFAARTTNGTITPTVGGEPANTFPVDDIGFFDGQLVVPEFAPPGQQEVRATYQGETATALITVIAKKAQLVVTKAVKAGKNLSVGGSLFKPGEKVTLKLTKKGKAPKGTKKSYGTSVTAGPDGSIAKTVKLKKAAKGKWKVAAKGASSGRTAGAGFKVS